MIQGSVGNAVAAETKMIPVTVVVAVRGLPGSLATAGEAGAERTPAEIIGGDRLISHVYSTMSPHQGRCAGERSNN